MPCPLQYFAFRPSLYFASISSHPLCWWLSVSLFPMMTELYLGVQFRDFPSPLRWSMIDAELRTGVQFRDGFT